MGVALPQKPIDFPQRIFAAPPGPKAEASRPELDFEDRLDDHLQCRLHNPVPHRRYPQRARLAVPFGYLHPFDRVRPIAAVRQAALEFSEIPFRPVGEPLNTPAVHARRPFVPRDTLPREVQGRRTHHFVDQTKPFAPSDAVAQRRHHAVRPDRSFRPPQTVGFPTGGVSPLLSLDGTAGVLLLHAKPLASSFLPSFPRSGLCCPPLSAARRGLGSMKALTPDGLTQTARSLRLRRFAVPTFRPQPRDPPHGRFECQSLQRHQLFQASPSMSRLATRSRRNRFVLLRTAGSPPVALHPASRRRSDLQFPGLRPSQARTCTVPTKRPHGRTHGRRRPATHDFQGSKQQIRR